METETDRPTRERRACDCGHSQLGHLQGEGLCMHCNRPMCLVYRERADMRVPASV